MSTKSVVIHPGSYNLYIGLESSSTPVKIPQVIAYRNSTTNNIRDSNLITFFKEVDCSDEKLSYLRDVVSAEPLRSLGGDAKAAAKSALFFNKLNGCGSNADAESLEQNSSAAKIAYSEITDQQPYAFGYDALHLNPESVVTEKISVKWLFKDLLNYENKDATTISSFEKSLITLFWKYAVEEKLKVPAQDISSMNFVLIIPDCFNKNMVISLAEILYEEIGFNSGIIIQESVAVCYHNKLPEACIVDIGHSKVSISCVEDGLSLPSSRVRITMGGSLIDSVLLGMLKNIDFPIKNFDPVKKQFHFELLENMKKKLCSLKQNIFTDNMHWFNLNEGGKYYQFSMKDYGDLSCSTLAFFSSKFLKCNNLCKAYAFIPSSLVDYSDLYSCHENNNNGEILSETKKKSKGEKKRTITPANDEISSGTLSQTPEKKQIIDTDNEKPLDTQPNSSEKIKQFVPLKLSDDVLSLDEAIAESILSCENEELIKKMFANIYIVGGGGMFEGFGEFLKQRLLLKHKYLYNDVTIDVTTSFEDCEPCHVVWKGGCILANANITDGYINKVDWTEYGSRAIRERSIFLWNEHAIS